MHPFLTPRVTSDPTQMQDLISKVNESCFSKCAGSSGDSLSGGERQCLANCMGRYMDTIQEVTSAVSSR